jgi:threonylcarbamoyladenosine tRNA methylthiotransferase CDKAL1
VLLTVQPVCSLLFEDSERGEAEVWLINSCTVKSPSQSQMATTIAEGKARRVAIVVAGCVPQGDKQSRDLQVR